MTNRVINRRLKLVRSGMIKMILITIMMIMMTIIVMIMMITT